MHLLVHTDSLVIEELVIKYVFSKSSILFLFSKMICVLDNNLILDAGFGKIRH
jgi:hypothetical protein